MARVPAHYENPVLCIAIAGSAPWLHRRRDSVRIRALRGRRPDVPEVALVKKIPPRVASADARAAVVPRYSVRRRLGVTGGVRRCWRPWGLGALGPWVAGGAGGWSTGGQSHASVEPGWGHGPLRSPAPRSQRQGIAVSRLRIVGGKWHIPATHIPRRNDAVRAASCPCWQSFLSSPRLSGMDGARRGNFSLR